jgi:uncharacterized protein YegP (UPF0339 family)
MSNTLSRRITVLSLLAAFALCVIAFVTTRHAQAAAAAADAEKSTATFQVYKDKAEKYRWRLVTQNQNIIATSGQGYADKRGCMNGIESLKKNAPTAKIEEVEAPAEK